MASLKDHFIKHLWTELCDIVMEDFKLMLNKVLKDLCHYLPMFFSYPENPGGVQNLPPPRE